MTIMAQKTVAGSQARCWNSSWGLTLDLQLGNTECTQETAMYFETSMSSPSDTLPPTGPYLLMLPKQSSNCGPGIQTYLPIEAILI